MYVYITPTAMIVPYLHQKQKPINAALLVRNGTNMPRVNTAIPGPPNTPNIVIDI